MLPILAVIVTGPPGAIANTLPVPVTSAMAGSLDCQEKVTPLTTWPDPSAALAVSWVEFPMKRFVWGGVTVTRVMGSGVTITWVEPVMPSTVAEISTGPPVRLAVTTPAWLTDASSGVLDDQLTARLVTTMPLPVRAMAVS
jgi:hypothetical protein